MFKRCVISVAIVLLLILIIICFVSGKQVGNIHRDPQVLMDKFYRYRQTNPEAAKRALLILLAQDKNYQPALIELSRYQTHTSNVIDNLSSYLPNYKSNSSKEILNSMMFTPKTNNLKSLKNKIKKKSEEGILKNKYYSLKNKNNIHAKQTTKYPEKLQVLQELGFIAIKKNKKCTAIKYFSKAYKISKDPNLAMQLGYLYECIHKPPIAYKYFRLASKSNNCNLSLAANNAMTNLSGLQIKALPKPYFSETFFTPYTQSRFGLTVRPFLTRLGVEQGNKIKSREYIFLRRTDDNKSKSFGEISQIYEDDVQIEGMGIQLSPIANFPIVAFLEGGIAYDLVYRQRNLWRGDLRAGLMYYDQFGVRPAYYDKLTFGFSYFSDLYADTTYFSRYNNNVISGARTHQGVRLVQYHTSIINAYLTGRVIVDTKRLFYNNFAEGGPGIAFIPNNRFDFQLRFEHLNGTYIPAGAIPNPYRQTYVNNLIQLLFYAKI